MKYIFSNKRDITETFPSSSRRAANVDWKLFDIHDDDRSETLSACSRPRDEYGIREVPKKFWESKGCEQNRELEELDEVSGSHIEEQNGREHEELQEDKTLDRSEVPEREHFERQEQEQELEEHGESQANKTLDQSGVPRREQVKEQGQKILDQSGVSGREQVEERERESVECSESQEDKTLNKDEVPEREQEQEQEQESKQHGESQKDESPDQDEDSWDEQSKLRTVPELAQPIPVGVAPKPKVRKLKGRLVGKMLKDSRGIMKVEDPRDSDVVIL